MQWMEAWLKRLLAFSFVSAFVLADARAVGGFRIGEDAFLLEGEEFVARGGEMHYARIPREHWPHRLALARAMGLNTVSTYLFWNYHEPKQGELNFTGNADIAEFCRLAQKEGLKVIIRPGPYVCAEWDFGGLPWWLLTERKGVGPVITHLDGGVHSGAGFASWRASLGWSIRGRSTMS